LEEQFKSASEMDSVQLADRIANELAALNQLTRLAEYESFQPGDSLLVKIESSFFQLAPALAAQPARIGDYISIYGRLRLALQRCSQHWDMNSKIARDWVYRLIYGGRIAIEEVMLQSPEGLVPQPVRGVDEPSATPKAMLLGVEIHSGDILVSRGGAATSALIARGNDYPGNFSHVALVHIDPKTSLISIVESHIERGVIVASLDSYLNDTKLRIMVLRPRADVPALLSDQMLPHKAASFMLARAQSGHIPYDFAMDTEDESRLFCSEVVAHAYSHFGIALWKGTTTISGTGVRNWLADFGVEHFTTKEPSDLEYDPQLSVVAEWRDLQTLYKDHLDNAVVDAMLEGADRGDRLQYSWYLLPLGFSAKTYSSLLNLFGGVGPIPEGMGPVSALKNNHYTATHTRIKSRLVELAEQFQREHGYRPPYWELVKLARLASQTSD